MGCLISNKRVKSIGVPTITKSHGVLLIVFQALSLGFVQNTAAGFINAFGGNDFSIIAIVVGGLARLLGL